MAIFGGGNRMNAYGEPLVDSTLGEALGGMLGKGIKDRLYDDEGLFRASPEGPGAFIMGEKAGIDKPYLGEQKGIDPSTMQALGKIRFGKERGVDQSTKDFIGGLGSRLRSMFGGKQDPDAFTEACGGTYNTELPAKEKTLFNKEERIAYNPQEVMSGLKRGTDVRTFTKEQLGPLQQLMKDETSSITNKPFYEGTVDSIYGPQTQQAFNAFMKSRDLYEEPIEEYKGDGPVYTEPSSRLGAMFTPQGVNQN